MGWGVEEGCSWRAQATGGQLSVMHLTLRLSVSHDCNVPGHAFSHLVQLVC